MFITIFVLLVGSMRKDHSAPCASYITMGSGRRWGCRTCVVHRVCLWTHTLTASTSCSISGEPRRSAVYITSTEYSSLGRLSFRLTLLLSGCYGRFLLGMRRGSAIGGDETAREGVTSVWEEVMLAKEKMERVRKRQSQRLRRGP